MSRHQNAERSHTIKTGNSNFERDCDYFVWLCHAGNLDVILPEMCKTGSKIYTYTDIRIKYN